MRKVTGKQMEVLNFVKEFIDSKGYSPTRAEIADGLEIFPNAAQERVTALIKKGAVTQDGSKARTLKPVEGFNDG